MTVTLHKTQVASSRVLLIRNRVGTLANDTFISLQLVP